MEEEKKPESPKKPAQKPQQNQHTVSEAEELKNLGNQAYKAKKFEEAISYYDQAIEKNGDEVLYYNNKAAVYLEMKQLELAMQTVDTALDVYNKGSNKDFVKLAKLYARKGTVYRHMNDFKSAIQYLDKSMLEDNQYKVKEELKVV